MKPKVKRVIYRSVSFGSCFKTIFCTNRATIKRLVIAWIGLSVCAD
jgi:hypothetical protein